MTNLLLNIYWLRATHERVVRSLFCVLNIIPPELLCNMKFRILMYNLIAPEEADILYTIAYSWEWR